MKKTIIYKKIKELLVKNNAWFEELEHQKVITSKDAALVRGTNLDEAAKAIILKAGDGFIQCVLQGNRLIVFKVIKKALATKKLRMAKPEEVLEVTGCTVGSVPPTGGLFGLRVFLDENLVLEKKEIVFSAGSHYISIKMKLEDYVKIFQPKIISFSKLA